MNTAARRKRMPEETPYLMQQPFSPWQIVFALLVLAVVVVLAYYSIYFLATKTTLQRQTQGIRVVDRFSLSRDKTICLIEAVGNVYLVAITNQGVTLLDILDKEAYEAAGQEAAQKPGDFLQKGFAKGVLAFKNHSFGQTIAKQNDIEQEKGTKSDFAPGLQMVQEEDDLDVVFRKIQARRAAKSAPASPIREEQAE